MSGLLFNIIRRHQFYNIINKTLEFPLQNLIQYQSLSGCLICQQKQESTTSVKSNENKKKPKESLKITLIGQSNSIMVTSLQEAQKLSRRRDMKLVKINDLDTKTQRPVYKLLTTAQILADDECDLNQVEETTKSNSPASRKEKFLSIGSRISDNDLNSRIKNISKWLGKGNEVRLLLQTGTEGVQNGEKIFTTIENAAKESGGRIVQKRIKGGNIKFSILPAVEKSPLSSSSSSNSSSSSSSSSS